VTARRSSEPVPPWTTCKWLARCHGAAAVRAEWKAHELWCRESWQALDLPRRGPCGGCPLFASSHEEAA
jgi:hypothetical protein